MYVEEPIYHRKETNLKMTINRVPPKYMTRRKREGENR